MLCIVGEGVVLKERTGAVRRSLTFLFHPHPDSSNLLWYGLAVCLGVGGWLTTAAVPSGLRSPATPTITLPAPYKVYPQDNWSRLEERPDNNCWKIVAELPLVSAAQRTTVCRSAYYVTLAECDQVLRKGRGQCGEKCTLCCPLLARTLIGTIRLFFFFQMQYGITMIDNISIIYDLLSRCL